MKLWFFDGDISRKITGWFIGDNIYGWLVVEPYPSEK
jgi:hypothetical protein